MHPKVASAIQEIDAAVFSGGTFEDPAARAELLEHMAAWARELASTSEGDKQVGEVPAAEPDDAD